MQVTRQSRMFGVDCEMCLTMNMISELTRLTVVDEDGIVLLDELVKPRGRIINYLTQFSGEDTGKPPKWKNIHQ